MTRDARTTVMLVTGSSVQPADWRMAVWSPRAPLQFNDIIAVKPDPATRVGIGASGHLAVLAQPGSVRLVNVPDPSTIKGSTPPKGAPDDISRVPDGLIALAVGDDRAHAPYVACAFETGELCIGTPGSQMDRINPGIGPVVKLWIGERLGIIAPIWAAGAKAGGIAVQGPDRVILNGHRGPINDLRFSADFSALASASEDGTARIWRLADGASIVLPTGASVRNVAWTEDQRGVVTVSADGSVRIWPARGWASTAKPGGGMTLKNSE